MGRVRVAWQSMATLRDVASACLQFSAALSSESSHNFHWEGDHPEQTAHGERRVQKSPILCRQDLHDGWRSQEAIEMKLHVRERRQVLKLLDEVMQSKRTK